MRGCLPIIAPNIMDAIKQYSSKESRRNDIRFKSIPATSDSPPRGKVNIALFFLLTVDDIVDGDDDGGIEFVNNVDP